jgi:hypothetical protein
MLKRKSKVGSIRIVSYLTYGDESRNTVLAFSGDSLKNSPRKTDGALGAQVPKHPNRRFCVGPFLAEEGRGEHKRPDTSPGTSRHPEGAGARPRRGVGISDGFTRAQCRKPHACLVTTLCRAGSAVSALRKGPREMPRERQILRLTAYEGSVTIENSDIIYEIILQQNGRPSPLPAC